MTIMCIRVQFVAGVAFFIRHVAPVPECERNDVRLFLKCAILFAAAPTKSARPGVAGTVGNFYGAGVSYWVECGGYPFVRFHERRKRHSLWPSRVPWLD